MRELSPKWTDVQRDCIRSRGETLLVSAAAGSGKTSVLTERIIDRILDEENPLDLSRVLVVTFTKAAAAELRNRIRESLSRELAARPENRRLRNQVVALGSAKISTIDSFYYSFVRTHFSECHVSAGVRVADEAESRLLAKTVMDALLDDYFEGRIQEEKDRIESFGAFSNLFVTSRSSDSLAEILLGLYTKLSGFAEGIRWLSRQADAVGAMDPARFPCGDSSYEAFFRDILSSLPGRFLPALSKCAETVRSSEAVEKNYVGAFDYAKEWLTGLSERLQRGAVYYELRDYLSYDPPKLGSGIRGEKKTAESEAVKRLLSEIRDRVRETADRYFRADPSHLSYLFASHSSVSRSLYRLLSLFELRLRAEKERRGVLSFPDLARLTLELLEDPETGEFTDIARETASRFDEIYIDEYQDVSPIQDRIFAALSSPRNRFMVGDAKQSIYAFRGATPELFLNYRARFAEVPAEGRTIFLSSNFRSDSHIIRFCNNLFAPLFPETGDTPYSEEDALLYAKPESGEEQQSAVEFALFDRGGTAAARPEDSDLPEEETDGDEDAESVPLSEAAWVARRIQQLLSGGTRRDGTPLRPGDIAVLVRSASASAEPIRRALSAYGIPSRDSVSRAFFENPEVLLIYSLLTVIDNPQKDVFLAGTLKSPLYRVTLDELIHIRTAHPEGSLFDALTAFTEETGFAKGQRFLERLEYYRHLAGGIPIDRFLWMLYEDTGILSLVYRRESDPLFSDGEEASPAQMRANLMMFYEYARSFSSGAFRGLYEFVEFIGSVIEDKAKLPVLQTNDGEADAVSILTIHLSKGLEYPVCFVCGLGKKFNTTDFRKPVLLERDLGLATYIPDPDGSVRIDSLFRDLLRERLKRSLLEEEARILYVALTRAKEQLYLTATVPDAHGYAEKVRDNRPDRENCYAAWILTALSRVPAYGGIRLLFPAEGTEPEESSALPPLSPPPTDEGFERPGAMSYFQAKQLIRERFSFVYPDEAMTRLPAKQTVSALVRKADASESDAPARLPEIRPRFLSGGTEWTGAERGTLTHRFLQYCDFERLEREGVRAELNRMTEAGFLTPEEASAVSAGTISRFLRSDLFRRLKRARWIRRELQFNQYLPVSVLSAGAGEEGKVVLVQGIIDCLFEDESGLLVLVDYKTDFFSEEELASPSGVEAELTRRHGGQLALYRIAAEGVLCRPVDEVRLFSFALGRTVLL